MTRAEVEQRRIDVEDRVYVQYANGVVRSGVFLGLVRLPMDPTRTGLCLSYDAERHLIDWVDVGFLNAVEVTIPRHLLGVAQAGRSKTRNGSEGLE